MIGLYSDLFRALAPETTLVGGAIVALALDLSVLRRRSDAARSRAAQGVAALALVVALAAAGSAVHRSVFAGALVFDATSIATRMAVLVLAFLAIGVGASGRLLAEPAEYASLALLGTTGLLLIAATQDLLLAFLGLELSSLSFYLLVGFDRRSAASAEAGLKYFLFGAAAAAFLLFGLSLVFGAGGSLEFSAVARAVGAGGLSPMLRVGIVMVIVGLGFKVAAAPFHLWAPDVYEGAPPQSAALIASASKVAGVILFVRLLWFGLGPAAPVWIPVLGAMAALSLVLGTLGALGQGNFRRLIAYSAVAHAGALLLGLMVAKAAGAGPVLYYAATYALGTVGTFAVIAAVDREGGCQELADLRGLGRRSPLLAGCLAIFMLSLAGIPPLAGFFGKFIVFAAALRGGARSLTGGLALGAIALSAVALYYYLQVLKQALLAEPSAEVSPLALTLPAKLTAVAAAALIVLLGLFPTLLLRWL